MSVLYIVVPLALIIAAIAVGGVLLYWQPWRRRHAANKGGNSSSEAPATGDP